MTLWGVLKFARGLCAIFGDSLINFKQPRALSGTVDRTSIGVVRVIREPPGHALGTVGGGIKVWVIALAWVPRAIKVIPTTAMETAHLSGAFDATVIHTINGLHGGQWIQIFKALGTVEIGVQSRQAPAIHLFNQSVGIDLPGALSKVIASNMVAIRCEVGDVGAIVLAVQLTIGAVPVILAPSTIFTCPMHIGFIKVKAFACCVGLARAMAGAGDSRITRAVKAIPVIVTHALCLCLIQDAYTMK